MSSIGKVLGAVALFVLAVVGLLMSLCGGMFTFAGLTAHGDSGLLVISVPCLLGGLAAVWFATRRLREGVEEKPPEG